MKDRKDIPTEQKLLFKEAVMSSDIVTLESMVKEGFKVSVVAWESMVHAVKVGDCKVLSFFHGLGRNIFAFNNSLLVLAVQNSQFEVVKYFVENGAKLTESPTVLIEAYKVKNFAIANYLMVSDPKLLLDKRTVGDCSRFSEIRGLKLLIDCGASEEMVFKYLMPRLKAELAEYLKIKEENAIISDDISYVTFSKGKIKSGKL